LPTVTSLAERFARTVAPASAANVLGGSGTQTSSQTSRCSTNPGTLVASNSSREPNGTVWLQSRIEVDVACAPGANWRRS
jgi:hypothetical protein